VLNTKKEIKKEEKDNTQTRRPFPVPDPFSYDCAVLYDRLGSLIFHIYPRPLPLLVLLRDSFPAHKRSYLWVCGCAFCPEVIGPTVSHTLKQKFQPTKSILYFLSIIGIMFPVESKSIDIQRDENG
jgi:hypothetical protein